MIVSANNLTKVYNNKPLHKNAAGLFAIQNISFEIDKGECVGIIGTNGSGKSTLLKILCGITSPTCGEFSVNGRISALLELGTGFNPEYNGISNIYLNGAIQGLSKKEIKNIIPEIYEFSELGDFINAPVKTYSDGMFLRLAFACAIALKPDILIIDEALAVGDFKFRQKCFAKIEELRKGGVTILMVSHDIDIIRRFCDRTIWLEKGILQADGDTRTVSSSYMESLTGCPDGSTLISTKNHFGSAVGSIKSVEIPAFIQTGDNCKISCSFNIPGGIDIYNTALSVSVKNVFGLDLLVLSTIDYNINFTHYGKHNISFEFICSLCPGRYSLSVSLEDRSSVPIKYYDYFDCATVFEVISDKNYFGVFHTDCKIDLE